MVTVDSNIDVALCEKHHFESLLADHVPWAVAFAYYPRCGIVFETHKLVHLQQWRQQKRALSISSNVNLNQAAALWRHSDEYRSRKRVFFVLQMTIFATQLAMTGGIFDFWEEPNSYRLALFDASLDTWDKFEKVWRPLYEHLVERYVAIRNAYRIHELELILALNQHRSPSLSNIRQQLIDIYNLPYRAAAAAEAATKYSNREEAVESKKSSSLQPLYDPPSPLQLAYRGYQYRGACLTTQYILANGLSSLERDLAIVIQRHPVYRNLIHLSRTATLSPVDSIIASECNALLIDENDQYTPVAWSHHRFYQLDDEGPVRFDIWTTPDSEADSSPHPPPPAVSLHNPDGILVQLYFYAGTWLVSTVKTSDGSETYCERTSSSAAPSVSSLFWEVFSSAKVDLNALDQSMCYSFWLLHPMARQKVLHANPRLLLEGAVRWPSSGLVDVPLSVISRFLPFEGLSVLNGPSYEYKTLRDVLNICASLSIDKSLPLPIGGVILQRGGDRYSRIYLPCAFMQRLENIEKLQGDYLMQELEMVRLLVEQPGVDSAWTSYPLRDSVHVFNIVSTALSRLIAILESYREKIPNMSQKEVMDEVEKLGDIGHFVFLMKSTKPPFATVPELLRNGNQRKLKKYLAQWWTKEHSKAPPRTNLQYSYK